jgi:hypothetical protein
MNDLDPLYAKLLSLGFVVLNQAAQSGNRDWLAAELEMLHNVPSLLGEDNVERHRYYWFSERQHYIDWASTPGQEAAKSRMLTYYEPIWREMEPLVANMMQLHDSAKH